MGNSPDGPPAPFLLNDKIWEYINDLECNTTGSNEPIYNNNLVRIFPNPGNDIINIQSDKLISEVGIFNFYGQLIKTDSAKNKELSISVSKIPCGLYFVKVALVNGKTWTGKLIKE